MASVLLRRTSLILRRQGISIHYSGSRWDCFMVLSCRKQCYHRQPHGQSPSEELQGHYDAGSSAESTIRTCRVPTESNPDLHRGTQYINTKRLVGHYAHSMHSVSENKKKLIHLTVRLFEGRFGHRPLDINTFIPLIYTCKIESP